MTTPTERIRDLARAEVARNAPPATRESASATALLGPETAAAAARRQAAEKTAARGAA